jgi:hypothetical protein
MLPAGDSRMEWTLRLVGTGIDGQSRTWVCVHWTHALDSVSWFSVLWRDRFRACVYTETGVSGTSVTVSSCFGIGMPSFFSNSANAPAIFVR